MPNNFVAITECLQIISYHNSIFIINSFHYFNRRSGHRLRASIGRHGGLAAPTAGNWTRLINIAGDADVVEDEGTSCFHVVGMLVAFPVAWVTCTVFYYFWFYFSWFSSNFGPGWVIHLDNGGGLHIMILSKLRLC